MNNRPDRIRKISERGLIWAMVPCEPTMKTISQEKISTTIVRSAVATSESVLWMPHLARIEVIPAKTAESTAVNNHIESLPTEEF